MHVLVADRKYPDLDDPYGDIVREAGGTIEYANVESESELLDVIDDANVVMLSKAPITRTVVERMAEVRSIIRLGTGVDTINVKAATEHGIPVSNTPGRYCAPELSTHAIGLMIAAAHEVVYADGILRASEGWAYREDINPMNRETFGIFGLGYIGRSVVPRAKGLDMDVIACDPYLGTDLFDLLEVERVTFDELLARADCISIHTPLTAETHHRFSTPEFEAMQETAVLVNTARGPIVDEAALVEAVESGEIWGAGLDVFETEPPDGSPAIDCDRIVCSPHHGGSSQRSRERALEITREELGRVMRGEHPQNVINPGALQYTDELLNPERHEWQ